MAERLTKSMISIFLDALCEPGQHLVSNEGSRIGDADDIGPLRRQTVSGSKKVANRSYKIAKSNDNKRMPAA